MADFDWQKALNIIFPEVSPSIQKIGQDVPVLQRTATVAKQYQADEAKKQQSELQKQIAETTKVVGDGITQYWPALAVGAGFLLAFGGRRRS